MALEDLKKGYGVVVVHPGMYKEHTHIYLDGNRLSENIFTWKLHTNKADTNYYRTPFYLSLQDISDQYFKRSRTGVLTVVVETEDNGTIYQIGRHNHIVWEKHGTTKGYT